MENTEARLMQENQQLRAEKEKEQKSRKSEKKISKSYTNGKQNIKPKNKIRSNTGHTPPINKEESGEKQSETVKKGKKAKVIDLESCLDAERGYEPVAAGKPNPKSINVVPELKNSPSKLSHPSRSKSNKARIFMAGDSIVRDVKVWLLSREKYVKVY